MPRVVIQFRDDEPQSGYRPVGDIQVYMKRLLAQGIHLHRLQMLKTLAHTHVRYQSKQEMLAGSDLERVTAYLRRPAWISYHRYFHMQLLVSARQIEGSQTLSSLRIHGQ